MLQRLSGYIVYSFFSFVVREGNGFSVLFSFPRTSGKLPKTFFIFDVMNSSEKERQLDLRLPERVDQKK